MKNIHELFFLTGWLHIDKFTGYVSKLMLTNFPTNLIVYNQSRFYILTCKLC